MEYVRLGSTGLKVSRLCLGCMTYGSKQWREWVLEEEESLPFFRRALEFGINFFDTADMYSVGVSEEITGRALKQFAQRDRVVLATKVFNPMGDDPNQRGLSRKHIQQRHRRQPAAPRHRLCRSLPDPPLRLRDPDRGDTARAGRYRARRQGALHRRLQHVRLPVRENAACLRPIPAGALRLHAEPLQPGLSRGRARDAERCAARRASA